MAGVVAPAAPTPPSVGDIVGVLRRLRASLRRNAQGGATTVVTGWSLGIAAAVLTLLMGLIPVDPGRTMDLLATLVLTWQIGWVMGPIALRSSGQGIRPEHYALLPLPPLRFASALLVTSFLAATPLLTALAFGSLLLAGLRLGLAAVAVSVPAILLQVVAVVLVSKVAVAGLTATLNSRRGRDLGGILTAVVIAIASGGWSLIALMSQALAVGPPAWLSAVLRWAPTGWGPIAVVAAGEGDWGVVAAALAGLALLAVGLLFAWAALLPSTMQLAQGSATRVGRRNRAARLRPLPRWLPRSPLGAATWRELLGWRRNPDRNLVLLMGVLLSVLNLSVPAFAFGAPGLLPFTGPAAGVFVAMGLTNVYGEDGTAFWVVRMLPGREAADVRARQLAVLLVATPLVLVLSVVPALLVGQDWVWGPLLAGVPPLLGGAAGLLLLMAVMSPTPLKDPHLRAGAFDVGDDPDTGGTVAGKQFAGLFVVMIPPLPAVALAVLGYPVPGILVGLATGALLYWWCGRVAIRRLQARGAEFMDLLHLGLEARTQGGPLGTKQPDMPPRTALVVNTLFLASALCLFPQGLVSLGFNLFGVDPEVRAWFLARFLPSPYQVPVAIAFIVLGVGLAWLGQRITKRATQTEP